MKRVVIGMKDGKPYVISCPTKVEVVFRLDKPKTLRRKWRTLLYQVKNRIGLL